MGLATLKSRDTTKVCLWMTIYIYIYIRERERERERERDGVLYWLSSEENGQLHELNSRTRLFAFRKT